jgi:hypothetical protein
MVWALIPQGVWRLGGVSFSFWAGDGDVLLTTDGTGAWRFGEEMRGVGGRCFPAVLGDSARGWT